ncbi:MAG: SDR family NAD(P)-dependent oxidoreductase [Ruminococcaceae bacterium]|nr:SDR family NAD(P)-dependent oxidoreductase [Oscillospiraceae bacterium]
MKIAVITGASSGMGKEFVVQLAREKSFDEIWVIARRLDRLEALQSEVSTKIRPISLDLTKEESIAEYSAMLEREKPVVDVMVNASGFGRFGTFSDMELETMYRMIDLNSKAYVGMTYATLPYLTQGSEVYQLDSLSSFQPVPYICVYGATKAFVLSFSRALNVELKSRGIHMMAVCPGWVKTEFFDHAVTDDTITYYNKFFTPEQVITRAIRDMKKRKDVSICGFSVRAQVLLTKLLPHRLIMKIWCKQQKK